MCGSKRQNKSKIRAEFLGAQDKLEDEDTSQLNSVVPREDVYGIAIQFRPDTNCQCLRVNNIKKDGPAGCVCVCVCVCVCSLA
jgi:hypothetical protein